MIFLRIENLFLNNNILFNDKEEIFKEGALIKGEILEVIEDLVFIDIKGQGIIKASSEKELKNFIGKEMVFSVKTSEGKEIQLKPLLDEKMSQIFLSNEIKNNNSVIKMLKELNIKPNKYSLELVETLMKYNAPINKEILINGIKTLEKLQQLMDIKTTDKVILIEQNNLTEDKNMYPEKVDIKNLFVVDKKDYSNEKDLTYIVKEYLGEEFDKKSQSNFIKTISFFVKNNIKTSLSNIKNFIEINNDPIAFSEDLKTIDDILGKSNIFNKGVNFIENKDEIILNKEELKILNKRLDEVEKLLEKIGEKVDSNLEESLKDTKNKVDFLKELNRDLTFLFFPFDVDKERLKGVITLLKQNKRNSTVVDKINIFINLITNRLGSVKVACQVFNNSLSIKFNINENDLDLFKDREFQLIKLISSTGYSINKIEYNFHSPIEIMDTLVLNSNPTYFLDLKV